MGSRCGLSDWRVAWRATVPDADCCSKGLRATAASLLGSGPANVERIPPDGGSAGHGLRAETVGFARDDGEEGDTERSGHREHAAQLANSSLTLVLGSNHEAGRVTEEKQR